MDINEIKKKPHILKRAILSYRKIPDKKPYIEFIAAILTIPVLLTVILLNLNSLKGNRESKTPTTTEKIYVTIPGQTGNTQPQTTAGPCTPGIGEVDIASPEENEVVTDSPVFVTISHQKGNYCEVVWSYRINGGKWSDYDYKSIALYNLPKGNIKLDLRIKSVVNSETESISRNFIYQGESVSPTSASGSASAN